MNDLVATISEIGHKEDLANIAAKVGAVYTGFCMFATLDLSISVFLEW